VGLCVFPTTGYRVELRPAEPQGINPQIYILEKIVHAPTGPVGEGVTEVPVHYVEVTGAEYSHIQIIPDGVLIPVTEVF
jgi:hypothetical protein